MRYDGLIRWRMRFRVSLFLEIKHAWGTESSMSKEEEDKQTLPDLWLTVRLAQIHLNVLVRIREPPNQHNAEYKSNRASGRFDPFEPLNGRTTIFVWEKSNEKLISKKSWTAIRSNNTIQASFWRYCQGGVWIGKTFEQNEKKMRRTPSIYLLKNNNN